MAEGLERRNYNKMVLKTKRLLDYLREKILELHTQTPIIDLETVIEVLLSVVDEIEDTL